ncbi:MAG: selenocysteine-specific translation elongation factor [Rhodocyclaceae bacterium]|nr:selenocysteine-specific translation elongation factor [Rhodocyclaceae bacterium]
MIIGTAGHIDHGKTSLVKALTGVDADRLPEEKARGITVDLGYAYTPLPNGETLGFIDVPGHEKLIHNMLAGATGIDFLLLVVAADDGPMPQTREHLAIAELLGIARGAVALTKCDAVDPARQAAAENELHALLAGSSFAEAPVFRVSAKSGDGIAALHDHLADAAGAAQAARHDGRFRLAIDRCFTLSGIGTVVTGTIFSGTVQVGDTLTVSPAGLSARVRSLHAQDKPAERAHAGQRVALNLSGDFAREAIRRGMWALDPRQHLPLTRFAATLALSREETQALRHWTPVHVHLGAEDVTGRVALLEGDTLAPGAEALVEIVLDRDIACAGGDRFVLRDTSATRTLAGGRVLDLFPPTRHKRAPARLAALRLAAGGDLAATLAAQLAASPAGVLLERTAQGWNLDDEAAAALWRDLDLRRIVTRDGTLGFAPAQWAALGERLVAALAAEHERAPDMPGAEHERLRRLTLPTLPRAAFDTLLDEALAAGRVAQTSSWLHLPEHRVTLSAADRDLWATLAPLVAATPFQPPRVRDIAKATAIPEDTVRALMKRIARGGALYPVALDHYFSDEAVERLAGIVAGLCGQHGAARAAELRDIIGGGRKVAIHILEFFDRIGYTRRVRDLRGTRDEHVLREAAVARQWKQQ